MSMMFSNSRVLDEQGCNYVPLGLTIDEGMENRWHNYADTLNNSSGCGGYYQLLRH